MQATNKILPYPLAYNFWREAINRLASRGARLSRFSCESLAPRTFKLWAISPTKHLWYSLSASVNPTSNVPSKEDRNAIAINVPERSISTWSVARIHIQRVNATGPTLFRDLGPARCSRVMWWGYNYKPHPPSLFTAPNMKTSPLLWLLTLGFVSQYARFSEGKRKCKHMTIVLFLVG